MTVTKSRLTGGWPFEDIALHFARAWAEAVITSIERSKDARSSLRAREAEDTDFDQMSDPVLQRRVRAVWTAECLLVLSADQLERWTRTLFVSRGRPAPNRIPQLRELRNAIEHLTEADLDEDEFLARSANAMSIRFGIGALPGGVFPLTVSEGDLLLGVMTPDDLETVARTLLDELRQEHDEQIQLILRQLSKR